MVPLSASAASAPSGGSGDVPLPPGTVTNLAGRTSPQPSCAPPKTTEPLAPASGWSATVDVPSSLFSGKPAGAGTTETFALAADGTFTATDGSGDVLALDPVAGLPSGGFSSSIMANSTTAEQTFSVSSEGTEVARVTVTYSTITSFCRPAGLRMVISGDVAWKGGSGTISIPFGSQPTFDRVTRTKDNATAPYDPTRATFGRARGLAFDWSDSKKLGPTWNDRTESVDYRVGDSFLVDPVVTAAASSTGLATKTDYEGFSCYASGRFWVFFDDGAHEGYVSSADVSTWTAEDDIASGGTPGLFAFYCAGDMVYYATAAAQDGAGIYYRYGTLEPDGTIAWAIAEGLFSTSGGLIRGVSTAVDSTGAWWVSFGSAGSSLDIEVWRCGAPGACSWAQSDVFSYSVGAYVAYTDLVPLASGKAAVVFGSGYNVEGPLGVETFSGSSWSAGTFTSGSYRLDASACVSIGDTVECGVDSGDTALGYVSAAYGSNAPSWSGFEQLAPCSSSSDCYASMSTDGSSTLVMTFADSTTTVGYFESSDSGAFWGPEVDFPSTESSPAYVSSPFFLGDHIMAVWTSRCSSFLCLPPWDVRFAEAALGVPPTATPPWAESGLSPYESYVSNAAVYVSMGNGLLSIEQPTFTLPGRGLSVSPALFYNEPGAFGLFDRPYQTDNFTLADLGVGWSLNLPWLGTYYVHLPDGQEYPYDWKGGTDMQVHGPVDFELTSTGAGGGCPCDLILPSGVQFFFNAARQLTSEVDPTARNAVSFEYGANGMLSSIVDTVGRTVAFSYGSNNHLVAMTAPGGRVWSLGYTGDQLTSETDPVGRTTGFGYSSAVGSGWLVDEVDYPTGGAKVTLGYGEGAVAGGVSHVVTSRVVYSAAGSVSQSNFMAYVFSNDSVWVDSLGEAGGDGLQQGFVTNVFQPSQGVETTYYKDKLANTFRVVEDDYSANRLTATKIEDPSGNVLAEARMGYDSWGNVIYTKDSVGQQTWMSYANTNSSGFFRNLSCFTSGFYPTALAPNIHDRLLGSCDYQDASGNVQQETFYRYNGVGELTEAKVSHNGGWLYTDYTYDGYGNVLSVKDPDGNVVSYAYSPAFGSAYLTKESRTAGTTTIAKSYGYDFSTGFLTSTTDPNGQTTAYSYDAVGRVLAETSPPVNGVGSVVSYSYDDVDGVVTVVDPNLNTVRHYFDGLGRETRVQVLDGKGRDYSDTYYSYNWDDRVSRVTLPSGSVYAYSYDSVGRPLSQTNPDGTKSTVYYNDATNTVTTKDEDGNQATTSYDWNGKVEAVLQYASAATPAGTSYAYDLAGNLLSTTNADGQSTVYVYDDLNRLVRTTGPDGNATSYAYDSVGNLVSKTTADGAAIGYLYDSAYRLTGVSYPGGASTSYTYDPDGNILTVASTLSGATQDSFTYDAMGRLTGSAVSVAGGSYATSYAYDQASNLVSVTYPDGLVVPMSYDFQNRLVDVGSKGSIASFSYNLDGTVAQITFGDKEVQSYTYDSRDRVTSIVDALHNKAPAMNVTYSYDAAGNVVGLNSERFAYDGLNRLVFATGGWGTTAYSYDGAGNMLASTTNGVATGYSGCGYYPNGAAASSWFACITDKDGNIVLKASVGGTWTYRYDAEDEMTSAAFKDVVQQTNVYDGLGSRVEETTPSGSAVFTYQGVNLLSERNLTSGVTADHVYGDGMQLAKVSGGTTLYLHEDVLGSNRAETSVAKGKVDTSFSSDYQPYGQSYGATGSEPFRFTDRMLDSATGLYYDNARFYDPSIMRFLQKDPGGSDAASSYMYAGDNPLSYTDPTGMYVAFKVESSYFTQIHNWYRWYVWDASDRLSCDAGDMKACGRVAGLVIGGLVGGSGDVIDEAEQLGATVIRLTPKEASNFAKAGSEITGKDFAGLPALWWGTREEEAFGENLLAGYSAYYKEPFLYQYSILSPRGTSKIDFLFTRLKLLLDVKAGGPLLEGSDAAERAVMQLKSMILWRAAGEGRSIAFVNVQVLDRRIFGQWFVDLARKYDVQLIYFRIGE